MDLNDASGRNTLAFSKPDNAFGYKAKGVLVPAGYSAEGLREVTFTLKHSAALAFDSLHVYSVPMESYRTDIQTLRSELLKNTRMELNAFSGEIDTAGARVLQLAIPYSEGWHAKVNGEDVELFRCGGMFMGIELNAGHSGIELHYVTPWLREGCMVSAGGLVLSFLWVLFTSKAKRNAESR